MVGLTFDDYFAYCYTYAFQTFPNAYWDRTYYFQASPVTFDPNSDPDLISPLIDLIAFPDLFYRIPQANAKRFELSYW